MQVCKKYHGQSVFTDISSKRITVTIINIDIFDILINWTAKALAHLSIKHFAILSHLRLPQVNEFQMQGTASGLQRRLPTTEERNCASGFYESNGC